MTCQDLWEKAGEVRGTLVNVLVPVVERCRGLLPGRGALPGGIALNCVKHINL